MLSIGVSVIPVATYWFVLDWFEETKVKKSLKKCRMY
jgi:hypothetical protein